jgi:hypothetical protein
MSVIYATTQLTRVTASLSPNKLEALHALTQLSGMQLTTSLSPCFNT